MNGRHKLFPIVPLSGLVGPVDWFFFSHLSLCKGQHNSNNHNAVSFLLQYTTESTNPTLSHAIFAQAVERESSPGEPTARRPQNVARRFAGGNFETHRRTALQPSRLFPSAPRRQPSRTADGRNGSGPDNCDHVPRRAGPNSTDPCPETVFQREPGLRRLLGSYDNVCVDQIVQTNVTVYQFQVAFHFHSNRTDLLPKQTLTLQCLIPPDEANLAVQHQMTMAGGHVDIRLWPSQREVPVDSTLFIQAQPISSWYRGSNLRSYPLNCWVNSNASESVPRIYFVKHGCPAISMLGRGLSRMLHSPTSSPKIGLDLSRIIMSELGIEVNETLSLHCEYFPCTAVSTESLLYTPKCPPFYSCAGDRTETPIAITLSMLEPSPPQSAYLTVVPKQRAELGDVDCFLLCPDAGSAQSSIAEEEDNTAFSAYAAIVLTLASFATGMGMTAFLWCYYRRHNKRQTVRNAQQQQQQQQQREEDDEQAQPTPLIPQEHTYEFAQTDDHN
ncbi:Leukocyte-associated immunoglobulin-like receptor [Trichinella spiralis]|uniref:Leukocyte-associated immunoglobulin-like receptor n=1 Tax=Trichinella spiralis TaxID=6334 RepID=A0ABR3L1P6_TRISP